MNTKEEIERHVASAYLIDAYGEDFRKDQLIMGDPEKKEPDILYQDAGFEIGAVLKGLNTHIDSYEKTFLDLANKAICGRIPDDIRIGLVMQDDKTTVEHSPAAGFEEYPNLAKFLDGIFLTKSGTGSVKEQVVLNQKTRLREAAFPSVKNEKEFGRFIEELVRFASSVPESEYRNDPFDTGSKLYHAVVTNGKVVENPNHPLDDFVSRKVIEKLSEQKYEGSFSSLYLLLHNYSIAGNTEFTTDIHFYSHHRDDIFNLLFEHIQASKSLEYYSGIYFLDFSAFAFNKGFKLIDFSKYEKRPVSRFLTGYGEICIPVSGMRRKES
jgi:hypothetical protein